LRGRVRDTDEPGAWPVDVRSVRASGTVPEPAHGIDRGKKIKGHRQFLITDVLGLPPTVHATLVCASDNTGGIRPAAIDYMRHRGVRALG
jgi:hypothetical protein